MAEIEFLLKRKELVKKDEDDLKIDKLINPDKYLNGTEDKEYKVFYTPVIIDTEEMMPVLEDDDNHTALFDRHTGDVYVVKCKYRNYKYITEHLSGRLVRNIEHFAIDDSILDKLEKINQIK